MIYSQLRDLTIFFRDQNFSKIHKTEKKIVFGQNKKITCLMILNDKPNCQVSRILMNPRPIYLKRIVDQNIISGEDI
jgi:hypothetical protein